MPSALAVRQQVVLAGRVDQAVRRLNHGVVAEAALRAELLDAVIAHAVGADLALRPQAVELPGGLLAGRERVEAVQQVQVDRVELQALERHLAARGDVLGGQIRYPGAVGLEAGQHLGGDHQLVARHAGDRLAQHRLRMAVAIRVGGVEQVDATVEGAPDRPRDLILRLLAPESRAELPRPERDRRDPQAASSKLYALHVSFLRAAV